MRDTFFFVGRGFGLFLWWSMCGWCRFDVLGLLLCNLCLEFVETRKRCEKKSSAFFFFFFFPLCYVAMLLCDDEIPDTVLGPLSYICHMYFVVPAPSLSPFLEQSTISVLFGVLGCAAMLGALPFLVRINHVAFATVPYCCWRWYFRICPLSMYEKSPPESSRPPSRHGSPVLPTILARTLPIPLHQPKPC